MRLSELIRERKAAILEEFEDFARTHTASGASMDIEALRDDAAGMLEVFERDLERPQTAAEQEQKGKGDAPHEASAPRTAAEQHGFARAHRGFSMVETFAEYRALRASVMRHYVAAATDPASFDLQDVIRFNEAIDQALVESIAEYSRAVSDYRETFLAVLGHDLRSPLSAVLGASAVLADDVQISARGRRLATTIYRAAVQMGELIETMLAYTASRLGQDPRLQRAGADLGAIAASVVRETEMSHPGRGIRIDVRGDVAGEWDASRIQQALSNLVNNAVQHGAEDLPITVSVSGDEPGDEVVVAVHNFGAPIPPEERELIFEPFRQASSRATGERSRARMGLGLYITRAIAEAHGGVVRVDSSAEAGTTFSMRLPRRPPDPSSASG
ncbi:MAG TPA: sensor histidine kinase [Longimicrobiales bacterium]|nr:sensor histidine kinase [Longimicrobiales bacterium]